MSEIEDDKAISLWNNVLRAALSIPGARVIREKFLIAEFSKYVDQITLENAIIKGTGNAGIDIIIMDKVANSCIGFHTTLATTISAAAGIPGGIALLGTVPADLAQYYYQTIVISQKLAYIYGWPDIGEEEISDEYMLKITLFLGIMAGAKAANAAVTQMCKQVALEVAKRLPREALTKYGIYNVAKQVAKWMGISITKASFSRIVGKAISPLGAVISGGITLLSFLPMANNLKNYLRTLPTATGING